MRPITFVLAVLFAALIGPGAFGAEPGFVERCGTQLCLDGKVFRFASFNTPELAMRQDPYWDVEAVFDQEDMVKTVAEFGGRVARLYVLSIAGTGHDPVHVIGPGQYGEEAFVALDRAIALAGRYDVRLIIPFIDSAEWWGGVPQFAAMYGAKPEEFFTSPAVQQGYRDLVAYVLNRRNTITGVLYKDDPTVLAWETGNEIRKAPTAWTIAMAAYLKTLDPHHLVLDGNDDEHDPAVLDDPSIDLVTRHYYGEQFKLRFANDLNFAGDKKPTIVGEFGMATVTEIKQLLAAVTKSQSPGALLWMLGNHDSNGGWRWRCGQSTGCAYRWPGFIGGNRYDERAVLGLLHQTAWALRGEKPPAQGVPDAPKMLPVETPLDLRWLGVVGADTYDVEKSTDGGGTWQSLGEGISDSVFDPANQVYRPTTDAQSGRFHDGAQTSVVLQDTAARPGDVISYRVRAVSVAGASAWSDAVTATISIDTGLVVVSTSDIAAMGPTQRFQLPAQLKRVEIVTDASSKTPATCLPQLFGGDGSALAVAVTVSKGKPSRTTLVSSSDALGNTFELRQPCLGQVRITALRYAFGTYDLALPGE